MAVKAILQAKLSGGSEESDTFLRTAARPVVAMTDEVQQVIQDLKDTLNAYPFCVGLSAPQIGMSYAISIINVNRAENGNSLTLINPQIIKISGKKDRKRESCMSLWGEQGEVERREKLTISYQDEQLEFHQLSCSGFESRTIQHEIDHLNGVLYSDKLFQGASLQHADFFDDYSIIEK